MGTLTSPSCGSFIALISRWEPFQKMAEHFFLKFPCLLILHECFLIWIGRNQWNLRDDLGFSGHRWFRCWMPVYFFFQVMTSCVSQDGLSSSTPGWKEMKLLTRPYLKWFCQSRAAFKIRWSKLKPIFNHKKRLKKGMSFSVWFYGTIHNNIQAELNSAHACSSGALNQLQWRCSRSALRM